MSRCPDGGAARRMALQLAWVMWTGAASALQSETYGNTGPVLSWNTVASYADEKACLASRNLAVSELLRADPGAVKRKDDLVASRRAMPDGEGTVHTVTKFLCLPEGTDPEKLQQENAAGGPSD